MIRLNGEERLRSGVVVSICVIGSLALYCLWREAGLVALGISASAYLIPVLRPDAAHKWSIAGAIAGPVLVALSVAIASSKLETNVPASGLALVWVTCALAYPGLLRWTETRPRPSQLPQAHGSSFAAGGVPVAVALVAVGVFLRVMDISDFPEPFSGDEAAFARLSLEREAGAPMHVLASGFYGSSNVYFELQSWALRLPLEVSMASRLLSAVFGAIAIYLTFLFGRSAHDATTGVCAAAAVALLHVHIHFSRIAIPNVNDTAVAAATLFAVIWAFQRKTLTAFGIAGLVCGLAPYAWTTARIVPVAAIIMFAVALGAPGSRNLFLRGAGVFAGGFFIVASPLLLWWFEHPEEARTRESVVLIFAKPPGQSESWLSMQRAGGDSRWDVFAGQTQATFDALVTGPEITPHFNSEVGIFGALPAMLLAVGAVVALRNVGRPVNAAVLALFLASIVGGALITIPPVSAARLTGCIVPGAYLIALGAQAVVRLSPRASPFLQGRLALAIVVLSCVPGLFYYFGEWRRDQRYSDPDTMVAERWGELVADYAPLESSILWFAAPPVDANHPTIRLLLAGRDVYVFEPAGGVRSVGGYLARPSSRLIVVSTGSDVLAWQARFNACSLVEPSVQYRYPKEELNLTLFESDPACSEQLRAAMGH